MTKFVVIGNPVMSSAESLAVIKKYNSVEEAEREIAESILESTETINGVWYSFKEGTPYRKFNRNYSGKLRKACKGGIYGGDFCCCGRAPEHYSGFDSPRYLEVEECKHCGSMRELA
jgi:hypothetical protein